MADVYPQNSRVIWFDSSSLIIHPVLKTLKYDLDVEKDSPYISYPILGEGLLLLSTSRYIHRLPLDLTSSCKNKAYTEDSQAYNQSRQPHHSLNMRFQTARGKSDVKSDWEISCFYSFCSTKKKSKRIGSMFSCFTTSSPRNTTFWGWSPNGTYFSFTLDQRTAIEHGEVFGIDLEVFSCQTAQQHSAARQLSGFLEFKNDCQCSDWAFFYDFFVKVWKMRHKTVRG